MAPLPALQSLLAIISADPAVRMMQFTLLTAAVIVVFCIFYVLRDVVLRTNSFFLQLFCILVVAFLPGIGFLLYLLLRPAQTLRERQMEQMVRDIHKRLMSQPKNPQPQQHQQKPQGKK